jgi:hypothetical protein
LRDIQRSRTRVATTHLVVWVVGVLAVFLASFPPAAIECLRDPAACLSITETDKSNGGEDLSPVSTTAAPVKHNGVLKVSYQRHKRIRNTAQAQSVRSSRQAIIRIVDELKNQLALPFDVNVSLEKCNYADAYYDEANHTVTVCYELIESYYHLFSPVVSGRAKMDEAVTGAAVSVFLHELGHAVIDAWDLPITGREEDAADQFATLLMINGLDDGELMALNGARAFELFANLEKGQPKLYWDEHSTDKQRFYDEICLIYGHNPEKYNYLQTDGTLPAGRADVCEEDYVRLRKSWQKLLSPYVQKGLLNF